MNDQLRHYDTDHELFSLPLGSLSRLSRLLIRDALRSRLTLLLIALPFAPIYPIISACAAHICSSLCFGFHAPPTPYYTQVLPPLPSHSRSLIVFSATFISSSILTGFELSGCLIVYQVPGLS